MNIALNGCGRVSKALLQLWLRKNISANIVLLRRSTTQYRQDTGISPTHLFEFIQKDTGVDQEREPLDEILNTCPIDVWVEMTPTDLSQAETHYHKIYKILQKGISVITANKSSVLYDYASLHRIAKKAGAKIGLSAVMGASLPSFALGHYGTLGSEIISIEGILNGTSNFILDEMENSSSFQKALNKAIQLGIAESNYTYDIEGIDSGIKMSILASVLLGKNIPFDQNKIHGISHLQSHEILQLKDRRQRVKLVARYAKGSVTVSPEIFPMEHLFYHVNGPNKLLRLVTDDLSEITVIGGKSGLTEVAASMHRDLCWIKECLQGPSMV